MDIDSIPICVIQEQDLFRMLESDNPCTWTAYLQRLAVGKCAAGTVPILQMQINTVVMRLHLENGLICTTAKHLNDILSACNLVSLTPVKSDKLFRVAYFTMSQLAMLLRALPLLAAATADAVPLDIKTVREARCYWGPPPKYDTQDMDLEPDYVNSKTGYSMVFR